VPVHCRIRIDARNGAFGIIPSTLDGALVTQDFPMFEIDPTLIVPEYLALLMKSREFTEICRRASRGTTNRKRLKEALLLAEQIPVPPKPVQQQLLTFANEIASVVSGARNIADACEEIEQNVCNVMLLI
jgi:restriction endonuclease S subunit